ncbi:MAG: hypothetical protein R3C11_23300 [Planctomycetaceae bacterium]
MNLPSNSLKTDRPVKPHRGKRLFVVMMLILSLAGCATRGGFVFRDYRKPAPVFTLTSTSTEVFDHLNKTAYQVHGWRCTNCAVSARGIPVKLKAMVACEAPRRFRTVVTSIVKARSRLWL